jgi:hypothetical protein
MGKRACIAALALALTACAAVLAEFDHKQGRRR